ncbi:hypothetical protein Tco_0939633 [Tanacetum coccineum]|uniref:Uncharacterized protein n=1 Tax=Tanacetum coccineum TaxID=301880 RepID=A0ABQ5DMC8_9ASTR
MASMNTRLNIKKLNDNIIKKHRGSKQVGFKQPGPGVETGVHEVSIDDTAVAQGRLEDKQPEEKTNTDCLVKEQEKVHHGADVGAAIMKNRVPGQEGAKGNAAERYREDSNEAAFAVTAVENIYVHESLTFNDIVACEEKREYSHDYYWKMQPAKDLGYRRFAPLCKGNVLGSEIIRDQSGDYDVEKNGKWSYTYAFGDYVRWIPGDQMVCTRLDITSTDVVAGDGVTSIKRRRRDQSSDSVRIMVTMSGRGRLKEDLESSTWRRRQEHKATPTDAVASTTL